METSEVQSLIKAAVKRQFDIEIEPELEFADPHADFASNVAFKLAGRLKKRPVEIAGELAKAIKSDDIARAEAAGAGYLNLWLTPESWLKALERPWPKTAKPEKVQVEFISANPTGPLTLGNARGGFIGDVLARVLVAAGHEVTREYYFNDAGTQIRKLVLSVKAAAGLAPEDAVEYRGEYIKELAEEFKGQLEKKNDDELGVLLTQAIFERHIKGAIERMGIDFDVWFNEKSLVKSGETERALEELKRKGLVYDKEGAVWLESTKFGDERDRVLVKSNGDMTYLGNDIPYHLNILKKRGFDRSIKILGADHSAQFVSLELAISQLLPKKRLEAVIMQWVRLMRDGKEVKMSKRAGTYVTVDELIDEVGTDVARFFFLMRAADSQMEFDLNLAKEQSQKNPLFYVMYSYVRANSILRQAADKGLEPSERPADLPDEALSLVKRMVQFSEVLRDIQADYGVHRLTFAGLELARAFHDFYEGERIIDLPAKSAVSRLALVAAYGSFMRDYFALLGIEPKDKM